MKYDYSRSLRRIKQLVEEDSVFPIRNAVLEARFALEAIAFERLLQSQNYISSDDLKRWKPKEIMEFLKREVDAFIASGISISVSSGIPKLKTVEEYQKLDWHHLGRQAEVNVSKLQKLYQRSSSHLHFDPFADDDVERIASMQRFLKDVIPFLRQANEGTLVMVTTHKTTTIECDCGHAIKRNSELLSNGLMFGCPNPKCNETYICRMNEKETLFEKRGLTFSCPKCSTEVWVPGKYRDKLRGDHYLKWECECGQTGFFRQELKLFSKLSEEES